MPSKYDFLYAAIDKRRKAGTHRPQRFFSHIDGPYIHKDKDACINFSSNNYLGLAEHPKVKQASIDYIRRYGAGAASSRAVSGSFLYHASAEKKFSAFAGREAAHLFSSGFQANMTIIPALAGRKSVIFADRSCHHSILKGALASGAKLIRFRHNDFDHLEGLLSTCSGQRRLIISESLFSMEGDAPDIPRLGALARIYDAFLMIDETHAIGVLGPQGRGAAYGNQDVDIVVAGFGKAGGASGAFAACAGIIQEFLFQFCGGIIYSTAVCPSIAGAVDAAIDLIPSMDQERELLFRNAAWVRKKLLDLGCEIGGASAYIIPIVLGDADKALSLQSWLFSCGILSAAIRPPTVIDNHSLGLFCKGHIDASCGQADHGRWH